MSIITFRAGALPRRGLLPEAPMERTFEETGGVATGYVLAIDLGQARDWSAVVVNQRVEAERVEYRRSQFQAMPGEYQRRRMVRHNLVRLHRYPLGTPYPDICRSLRDVMRQLPTLRDAPELVADATGVGRPVVDQMRELGLFPRAVTITGGFGVSGNSRDMRISKKALASLLDVVLSERRLKVPSSDPLAQVLVSELQAFTVRTTASGTEQFAAPRERDHDDVVMATALACWVAEKRPQPVTAIGIDWNAR